VEIEELVAQVWREVLKTESVGVARRFFGWVGIHSSRLAVAPTVIQHRSASAQVIPITDRSAAQRTYRFPAPPAGRHRVPPIVPVLGRQIPLSFRSDGCSFLQKLDQD
jgi:hypothetical protein